MIVLEANTSQVGYARQFIRGVLAGEVDVSVLGDLQLIASELFSNAIEHGTNTAVRLEVTCSAVSASVSVRSHGGIAQLPAAADWHVADPESIHGRGLGIVRRLADEITVERDDDNVTITARCAVPSRK